MRLAESIRRQVRKAVDNGPLGTAGRNGGPIAASTGVVFAHMSNPLQDAIRSAQQAIKDAKELLSQIQPRRGVAALSAGLSSDLERDGEMLGELVGEPELLRLELVRLVTRHGGTPAAGDALCSLGLSERADPKGVFGPVPAALGARFLSQEAQ